MRGVSARASTQGGDGERLDGGGARADAGRHPALRRGGRGEQGRQGWRGGGRGAAAAGRAERGVPAREASGIEVLGRLAAERGEQGGGGVRGGERVVPARQVAQQAGEAERRGHAGLVAQRRERVLAVVPVGRTARGGVGQGVGRGAGAHRGIEAAGEPQVAERQVVRVHPGVFGGEAAGGFAEGEAGDQPVAEWGGGGFGAGIEAGQRILGKRERGEQGGGFAPRRLGRRGCPAPEAGRVRLVRCVLPGGPEEGVGGFAEDIARWHVWPLSLLMKL